VALKNLAVDGVAVHAEVLSGGETTLADCTDKAVDVVDVLTRVHHKLVSTDWPQTPRTQLRSK